jgi:hypothetical protein
MREDSSTYSIWLAPEEDSALYSRLQQEIQRLSQENAGTEFAPHVTLIGHIEGSKDDVISKTEELASNLKVILFARNSYRKCGQGTKPSWEAHIEHCAVRKGVT